MAWRTHNLKPGDDVHTVFRTVNREFLFQTTQHHQHFLNALERQAKRYAVQHYAWTGMSNHHHVFNQTIFQWHQDTAYGRKMSVQRAPVQIDAMVRDTQAHFARSFNIVNNRTGHLIQDRTKQIKIYGDSHALTLLVYIFLNPVRAGIVSDPKDYPHSNYNFYAGGQDIFGGLFVHHPSYLRLGNSSLERQHKFRILIEHARYGWGQRRWLGASGGQSAGHDAEKISYDEFLRHSFDWIEAIKNTSL